MGDNHDGYIWRADEAEYREISPGFQRRIITGEDLMLCFWRIKEGSGPTPYGDHPHNEQFGLILSGQLDFRLGSDERRVLKPGDIYWAPMGFPHGDSHFVANEDHGETWILDIFTPPRDEYRNG